MKLQGENKIFQTIIETIDKVNLKDYQNYIKDDFVFSNPINPISKTIYSGINEFVLSLFLNFGFYKSPYFATFNQIKKAGGTLKDAKGKGIDVCYYNYYYKHIETGQKIKVAEFLKLSVEMKMKYKKKSFVNTFKVFNFDLVEGIELNSEELKNIDVKEIDDIEVFLKNTNAVIKEAYRNTASYSPKNDIITLPPLNSFKSTDSYYATLLHELIHWTGHSSRMNRLNFENVHEFRENYSFEELIAESGAILLCSKFKITGEFLNSCIYLKSFISKEKTNNKLELLKAFVNSKKAVNFLNKF